jgi:hypothetical protein
MATSTTYNRAFWNVMKGKEENNQNLSEGFDNAGAYVAPDEFREGFNTALAKENIFLSLAKTLRKITHQMLFKIKVNIGDE